MLFLHIVRHPEPEFDKKMLQNIETDGLHATYAQSTADRDKAADGNRKDGNKEIRKKSDRRESRITFDRIYRNRINKHAHIQSSKASIEAAQSESKHLENKKGVTRVNKDRTCAPRKHRSSSCLDSNFQSKILGKPWQKFCGSHISEKQPKSAKPQEKQTAQAFVATTSNTNSSTTTKPHDGKYTSPKADNHSPGSKKIEIRPTVNSNSVAYIDIGGI
jgi:hypothetical protein